MDLSTTYLGLKLKNPVVPSASPLSREIDTMKKMEDAGAAAIVMYSLFEEQINLEDQELDHFLTVGTESFPEALSYFPRVADYSLGPEEYLEHIVSAKNSLDIPIIGSINGVSAGGWMEYAKNIEEAGADALELNIYYIPTDPHLTGTDIENIYMDDLKRVKSSVEIPVAIKLSPFFSNISYMVRKLDEAGADGFVLFNRFYQPDLNIENLEVEPKINLSSPEDVLLPLRWIGIFYGRLNASIAATSGIHSAEDVIKMIMAGADVTMMCSALLKNGITRIQDVIEKMINWMEIHDYESVVQMKGSMSQKSVAEPAAFERANYMKAINQYRYK